MQRRNAELTPRFRVTCEPSNPGSPTLRLGVFLSGPPELERLDALAVAIRDDHPWRGQGTPLAGGPTPEQVAAQIWGPYRFIPGTGPGADTDSGPHITAAQVHIRWIFRQDYRHPWMRQATTSSPGAEHADAW